MTDAPTRTQKIALRCFQIFLWAYAGFVAAILLIGLLYGYVYLAEV